MRKTEHEMTFGWGKFSDLHIAHITGKCICETFPSPFAGSDH